jgi:hypothetical protein
MDHNNMAFIFKTTISPPTSKQHHALPLVHYESSIEFVLECCNCLSKFQNSVQTLKFSMPNFKSSSSTFETCLACVDGWMNIYLFTLLSFHQ